MEAAADDHFALDSGPACQHVVLAHVVRPVVIHKLVCVLATGWIQCDAGKLRLCRVSKLRGPLHDRSYSG